MANDFLGTMDRSSVSNACAFFADVAGSVKKMASHLDSEARRLRNQAKNQIESIKNMGGTFGDVPWKIKFKKPEFAIKVGGAKDDGDATGCGLDMLKVGLPKLKMKLEMGEFSLKIKTDFLEQLELGAYELRDFPTLKNDCCEKWMNMLESGLHRNHMFEDGEFPTSLSNLDSRFSLGQLIPPAVSDLFSKIKKRSTGGTKPPVSGPPGVDPATGISASIYSPPIVTGGNLVDGVPPNNPGPRPEGVIIPEDYTSDNPLSKGADSTVPVSRFDPFGGDSGGASSDGSTGIGPKRNDRQTTNPNSPRYAVQAGGEVIPADPLPGTEPPYVPGIGPAGHPVSHVEVWPKKLSDGTIVCEDGTEIRPDGTRKLPNGYVEQLDGTITLPDGKILRVDCSVYDPVTKVVLYPDGRRRMPDGSFMSPDGCHYLLDGTVRWSDGSICRKDCTVVRPDGTIWMCNGDVILTNGNTLHPDGSVTDSEGHTVVPAPSPALDCIRVGSGCPNCADSDSVRCYKLVKCFPQGVNCSSCAWDK